jgi:hypothetical protein
MLGHELRNPLSAISSAASLIGLPGVSADGVQRAKKIIQRQSQHLGRIVDDLLDLSRAMSGKILLTARRSTWPRWWRRRWKPTAPPAAAPTTNWTRTSIPAGSTATAPGSSKSPAT